MPLRFLTIDSSYASETIYHGTILWGIADDGFAEGYYYPPGGPPYTALAFTVLDGAFLYLNPAGYHDVHATGMNGNGLITGWLQNSSNQYQGFLDYNGSYGFLVGPAGATATYAYGINNNVVVGTYNDASNKQHGFSYEISGGGYTPIDYPGAIATALIGVDADSTGTVGYYVDSAGEHHGLGNLGAYQFTYDDPLGANGTYAYGINNRYDIVGYYIDSAGYYHGFLVNYLTGFSTTDSPGAC
jgi:hypothetical protein